MKTWEMMIKELTENPNKEFTSKVNPVLKATVKYFTDYIEIRNTATDTIIFELSMTVLNGGWEEVRKPIGFLELLKRISKEGDITVDFEDYMDEHNFKDASLGEVLLHLSKEFTGDCLAGTLLRGKWYVKE